MAWRLFGRSETKRIGINTLTCGEGQIGQRIWYDSYFFGFKTGSGFEDRCIGGIAPPSGGSNPFLDFNSKEDKLEIAGKAYRIRKDRATGGYRWSCKDGSNEGVEGSKEGAKSMGKKYCGIANFDVDEVLITSLSIEYEEKKIE